MKFIRNILIIFVLVNTSYGYVWTKEYDKLLLQNILPSSPLLKYNSSSSFWLSVFKGLAYAESTWKLNDRYVETGLGKDMVTKMQNVSEGLFQLSYQDTKLHGCEFSWEKDKFKDSSDLTKTIFEPAKQIKCAVILMEKQIAIKKTLYPNPSYYWSVLNPTNKRHFTFLKAVK